MPKLIRNVSNDKNKKTKKKYLSKFNDQWLKMAPFKTWLKLVVGDNTQACCSLCSYSFSIESGGVGALESHHGGVKHQQRLKDSKGKAGIGADSLSIEAEKNRKFDLLQQANKKREDANKMDAEKHSIVESLKDMEHQMLFCCLKDILNDQNINACDETIYLPGIYTYAHTLAMKFQ